MKKQKRKYGGNVMRKKKVNYKIGDIFRIPLDENKYGYGQVVLMVTGYHYGIIYDFVTEIPLDDFSTNKPIALFMSTSFLALEEGDWEIIGNKKVPEIKFPTYKQETLDDGFRIIDNECNVIDENPTEDQIENAIELATYSSSAVVDAINQKYIYGSWDSVYDDLIYKP